MVLEFSDASGAGIDALPVLVPPLRFSAVALSPATGSAAAPSAAPGELPASLAQALYRGSHPKPRNVRFLARLRLRSILSLTPKGLAAAEPQVAAWAAQQGVQTEWLKCEKPKDEAGGLSKEAAAKALLHVLDTRNLPCYVHCLDALSVTSLLTALLRRVQGWSQASLLAELALNLAAGNPGGADEELLAYQGSFVAKWTGGSDGVRLPPRRFIPNWCWPAPYVLARLRDPYDVLAPPSPTPLRDRAADRPSTSSGAMAGSAHGNGHARHGSSDATLTVPPARPTTAPANYGVGALPVTHPTMKLRFDSDPDLPPPPRVTSPQPLAPVTSRHAARESSQAREGRGLTSPASPGGSRPHSRAGRAPPSYGSSGSTSEGRTPSRPPSPRRRTLAVGNGDAGVYAGEPSSPPTGSPYVQHTLHRTSSRPHAPSHLSYSSSAPSPPSSPSLRNISLAQKLQQHERSSLVAASDEDVETPRRGQAALDAGRGSQGQDYTPRASITPTDSSSPAPSLARNHTRSLIAGQEERADAGASLSRLAQSSPTPPSRLKHLAAAAPAQSGAISVSGARGGAASDGTEQHVLAERTFSTSPEDSTPVPHALRADSDDDDEQLGLGLQMPTGVRGAAAVPRSASAESLASDADQQARLSRAAGDGQPRDGHEGDTTSESHTTDDAESEEETEEEEEEEEEEDEEEEEEDEDDEQDADEARALEALDLDGW